jgi:phospholipid-binding lipoprotein MlaA|tara:strand:+ start:58 stop:759 length:702 start_codon:yes stop_codon:yes gene_type:complete
MLKTSLIFICLISSSWISAEDFEDRDPLQQLNRKVYELNFEILDPALIKPLATLYDRLTPRPVRIGINNFFSNLDEIPNAVNSLLQGKIGQAANDTGRFIVNSVFGLGGVFDVATDAGMQPSQGEDFGQTLAVWGVSEGPYLMLPFLGPSTLRDAPSNILDSFLDPFAYNDNYGMRAGIKAIDIVALRAELLGIDDVMSGDKYIFVRDVYLQNREYVIADGAIEDDFDDLEDY